MDRNEAQVLLQNLGTNTKAVDIMLQYFIDNFATIINHFGGISPIVAAANAMAPHLKSLSGLFLVPFISIKILTQYDYTRCTL